MIICVRTVQACKKFSLGAFCRFVIRYAYIYILRWNKFNELTMKTTRNVNTKNQNVNTMDLMAYFVILYVYMCVCVPNIQSE